MKRIMSCTFLVLFLVASGSQVLAHEEKPLVKPARPEHKSSVNASEQATDPSAILTQMGFFYWTTITDDKDGDAATFLFQPVLPLSKSNLLRPALPFVSSPEPGRVAGIGDLFLLDAFNIQASYGTYGVGPVATLPTASSAELGTGKYSLGADFYFIYKLIPKNILGILLYYQGSVAGDDERADVSTLTFQPIWVMHFGWGYIGWTDLTATVDFENDGRLTFPFGVRFGTVFKNKKPWNMSITPYYTYQEGRDDDYGFKIGATLILPTVLRH